MAGLTTVTVVVRELTPEQRLAVQLVENIDREELSVLEESAAIARLIDFGRKPKDVADLLGKTQAWVSLRRKIEVNRGSLEHFVAQERTRDAETLAMLVDLEKIDGQAFSDMHQVERITRAAVREALELAKQQKLAPVAPVKVPEVPAPTVPESAIPRTGRSPPPPAPQQRPRQVPEPPKLPETPPPLAMSPNLPMARSRRRSVQGMIAHRKTRRPIDLPDQLRRGSASSANVPGDDGPWAPQGEGRVNYGSTSPIERTWTPCATPGPDCPIDRPGGDAGPIFPEVPMLGFDFSVHADTSKPAGGPSCASTAIPPIDCTGLR